MASPAETPGRWEAADWRATLAIVAVVLLANLPYLLGLTDPDPTGPRSQIDVSRPGLVAGANTLDPTDGYITAALGHLAAEDVVHGHLPLWNPYEATGTPLLAEGQSAALFPPTLLLLLDDGQFWEDLLLELVAGLATYMVLRRIGVSRPAAVAGGAAFALNGAFAWLATTSFNPVAFLPVMVLGIEQAHAAVQAGRRGGGWLLAVALALSLYAGFPETAYIDCLLAGLWLLWRLGGGDRRQARRLLGKGLAGAAVGLLLAAPFLVSFLGALSHEFVGFHNGSATALKMPSLAFPQLLLPYVYGPLLAFSDPAGKLQEIWGYAGGFVPFSLAFLGAASLISSHRRALKLILAIWLALALATIYGQPPILRSLLPLLPGASSVAFYRYTFPAVSFAFAVLAALGLDGLARRRGDGGALAGICVAAFALLALLALEAHRLVSHLDGGAQHSTWAWAQVAWTAAILASISTIAFLGRGWRGRRELVRLGVPVALVVLDVVASFGLHELSAPRQVRLDRAPIDYLSSHLGESRFFTLGPLAPNYGAVWRLASLNEIDLPLPDLWTRYVREQLDPYVNPIFFVGSLGGGRSTSVPSPAQMLRAHLPGYLGAAVRYVLTLPGQPPALPRGAARLVLRSDTSWIYELAHPDPYVSSSAGCRVSPVSREAIAVDCSRPGALVRRELDFPGWSASVDGRSTPITQARGAFQSVSVPQGHHLITFSYLPPGFVWSLAALGLGLVWLVAGPRLGGFSGRLKARG